MKDASDNTDMHLKNPSIYLAEYNPFSNHEISILWAPEHRTQGHYQERLNLGPI